MPVPRTVEAMYAVMTPLPLAREDRLPLPHDALLRHHGTSDAAVERLHGCPHQVVLHGRSPVERAGAAVREARVEALELAREHGGVVVDLHTPRVLELDVEDVSLDHATQWYVLDAAALVEGRLETDGLAQFGLPEVRVAGIDAATHAMAGAVVAGLAHRLIAEWPDHDPVGPATVTLRDVAHGLGDPQAATTPNDRGLDLCISYDERAHLLDVELLGDPATTLFA